QLALGALRALGEDVEDELGAVEHLQRGRGRDVARLGGGEVAVEDDHVRAELQAAQDDLLELAFAHQILGVELRSGLEDAVEHLDAGGARELLELPQRGLGFATALLDGHAHEDGLLLAVDRAGGDAGGEPFLERTYLPAEVPTDLVDGGTPLDVPQPAVGILGHEVGELDRARQTVLPGLDLANEVQAKVREVGQVVLGQALALQVGVHQAQTTQTALAAAGAARIRQVELVGVAHDHPFDLPLSGDVDADLAADFTGDLGEVAGEFGADDFVGAQAPAVG